VLGVTPRNLSSRARKQFEALADELGDARQEPQRRRGFVDRVVDAFKTD
jgi:hypothetical protein